MLRANMAMSDRAMHLAGELFGVSHRLRSGLNLRRAGTSMTCERKPCWQLPVRGCARSGVERLTIDQIEQFEERAAIIAESMQLSRADAEAMAAYQLGMTEEELADARREHAEQRA